MKLSLRRGGRYQATQALKALRAASNTSTWISATLESPFALPTPPERPAQHPPAMPAELFQHADSNGMPYTPCGQAKFPRKNGVQSTQTRQRKRCAAAPHGRRGQGASRPARPGSPPIFQCTLTLLNRADAVHLDQRRYTAFLTLSNSSRKASARRKASANSNTCVVVAPAAVAAVRVVVAASLTGLAARGHQHIPAAVVAPEQAVVAVKVEAATVVQLAVATRRDAFSTA